MLYPRPTMWPLEAQLLPLSGASVNALIAKERAAKAALSIICYMVSMLLVGPDGLIRHIRQYSEYEEEDQRGPTRALAVFHLWFGGPG